MSRSEQCIQKNKSTNRKKEIKNARTRSLMWEQKGSKLHIHWKLNAFFFPLRQRGYNWSGHHLGTPRYLVQHLMSPNPPPVAARCGSLEVTNNYKVVAGSQTRHSSSGPAFWLWVKLQLETVQHDLTLQEWMWFPGPGLDEPFPAATLILDWRNFSSWPDLICRVAWGHSGAPAAVSQMVEGRC